METGCGTCSEFRGTCFNFVSDLFHSGWQGMDWVWHLRMLLWWRVWCLEWCYVILFMNQYQTDFPSDIIDPHRGFCCSRHGFVSRFVRINFRRGLGFECAHHQPRRLFDKTTTCWVVGVADGKLGISRNQGVADRDLLLILRSPFYLFFGCSFRFLRWHS